MVLQQTIQTHQMMEQPVQQELTLVLGPTHRKTEQWMFQLQLEAEQELEQKIQTLQRKVSSMMLEQQSLMHHRNHQRLARTNCSSQKSFLAWTTLSMNRIHRTRVER